MNDNAWILAQTGLPAEFFFPQCYVADKAAWELATHVVKWPTLTFLVKICNFCLKSILIYRQNNLHLKIWVSRESSIYLITSILSYGRSKEHGLPNEQSSIIAGEKNDSRHDKRNLVPLILGDPHVEDFSLVESLNFHLFKRMISNENPIVLTTKNPLEDDSFFILFLINKRVLLVHWNLQQFLSNKIG